MSHWSSYQREEQSFLEPGDYRMEIVGVEEKTSRAGNPMLVVSLRACGNPVTLRHYIVKNEWFNRNMTAFFDAFPEIGEGNFHFATWVGAVGAARIREDDQGYLRVVRLLDPGRAAALPPWEGALPERQTVTRLDREWDEAEDEDLPFV